MGSNDGELMWCAYWSQQWWQLQQRLCFNMASDPLTQTRPISQPISRATCKAAQEHSHGQLGQHQHRDDNYWTDLYAGADLWNKHTAITAKTIHIHVHTHCWTGLRSFLWVLRNRCPVLHALLWRHRSLERPRKSARCIYYKYFYKYTYTYIYIYIYVLLYIYKSIFNKIFLNICI